MFNLGYRYSQKKKDKCQLLNFIVGSAKMAMILSRRNRIETAVDDDAVFVFVKILKACPLSCCLSLCESRRIS